MQKFLATLGVVFAMLVVAAPASAYLHVANAYDTLARSVHPYDEAILQNVHPNCHADYWSSLSYQRYSDTAVWVSGQWWDSTWSMWVPDSAVVRGSDGSATINWSELYIGQAQWSVYDCGPS